MQIQGADSWSNVMYIVKSDVSILSYRRRGDYNDRRDDGRRDDGRRDGDRRDGWGK